MVLKIELVGLKKKKKKELVNEPVLHPILGFSHLWAVLSDRINGRFQIEPVEPAGSIRFLKPC